MTNKCKICGTEYKTTEEALKCIESCKQKQKMERLPALIENLDWKQSQIKVMWETVAIDTSPEEFAYFLNVAESAGLNPFLREIYCWKSKSGKLTIMTGRDGYLKTAKNDPTFKGLASMDVCENDTFKMEYVNGSMQVTEHVINDFNNRGKLIGAWAKAEFNGQLPIVAFASAAEYFQNNKDVWKRTGSAMMRKVPESMVLKRGAGISGLVTREEIDVPKYIESAIDSPMPDQKTKNNEIDAEYVDVSNKSVPNKITPSKNAPKLDANERQFVPYELPGNDSQAMQDLKEYKPDVVILNKEKTHLRVGKFEAMINDDGDVWSNVPKFNDAGFDVSTCVPCLVAALFKKESASFISGKYGLEFTSEVDK